MLVIGFIFFCLWVCCTVDKMAVVLSFADMCSSYGFSVICWRLFEFWLVSRVQLFYLFV